ncbi:MAG: MFS transporter, partial [Candidatus Aenigmatarchaeota archaeon]
SFLFKLAVGLVAIFLPLYILGLGYSPYQVFIFFLVYYSVFVLLSFPNGAIASRIGYKHMSILSSPFILAFYLILRMNPSITGLYVTAVLGGLGFNIYWAGMNPEIAESTHSQNRERETGYFFSMPTLATMISPVLGGLVLAVYSFHTLFLFAAVFIGTSFVPFIFSKEHHEGMDLDPLSFFRRDHINDFLTYLGKGVNSIGKKVLWPLYLAVVIQSSVSIGGAGSLLALGSAAASIFLGRITDKDNRNSVLLSGAVVTGLTYLLMIQVTSAEPALIVSFLNGLGRTAMSLPIYSRAMDKAEKEDLVEYFAFRETALSMGRVITIFILVGIFTLFPGNFALGFVTIALSMIVIGYFGRKV